MLCPTLKQKEKLSSKIRKVVFMIIIVTSQMSHIMEKDVQKG